MDKLPVIAFEIVLSYLDTLDRHNAIVAFSYDVSALATHLNSNICLALEYRFRQHMIKPLVNCRRTLIKELDLTGIFWIPKHMILNACSLLVNLEYLYLLGTTVVCKTNFKEFQQLKQIKTIATAVDVNGRGRKEYWLINRRIDADSNKITFDPQLCFDLSSKCNKSHEILSEDWLSEFKDGTSSGQFISDLQSTYTKRNYREFTLPTDEDARIKLTTKYGAVKTLYIDEHYGPSITSNVNLEPIKYLVNLTTFIVDVHDVVTKGFLKPILQSCDNLKTLNIRNYNADFSLCDLQYARENLKDLSVDMCSSARFNLQEFLTLQIPPLLRLRRLYVRFNQMSDDDWTHSDAALENFIRKNPQLIFLWIVCMDHLEKIENSAHLLKKYQTQPHQSYEFKYGDDDDADVPLQHWDMMNLLIGFV
ncbi:uncharacterized protein [Atheta coriaria]|uniref:uncharacterized protein n=1 Tax=Dalotia coriaria TaxID=877792 RepID=UPI0031F3AE49